MVSHGSSVKLPPDSGVYVGYHVGYELSVE
jgi:hypothetical protein